MSSKADSFDTLRVKNFALDTLHADLVGIANIERFKEAPVKMSPQGVMPSAKSVIVMAIHHPDASIERGGLSHPQDIGPYSIQYYMNWYLDDISYRMALYLEDMGWNAVPIVSSNIWRYRGYKELTAQFAPDVSHLHCAVAAGLAEYGYSGLAITPEYGSRVRYVTVITDAPLTPTPLIEPGSVCDSCMQCKMHCMSGALSKELNGWNEIHYEDKTYRYVNKNLWRCAWGEHFDLDLNLPIPEHVDEKVIMEATVKYGRRGGEFGSCMRYCVPKKLRYFDKEFTNAPRRRNAYVLNPEVKDPDFHRGMEERVRSFGAKWGMDATIVSDAETARAKLGVELDKIMPGAIRAVTYVVYYNAEENERTDYHANTHEFGFIQYPVMVAAGYDAVRYLEQFGYASSQLLDFPEEKLSALLGTALPRKQVRTMTFLTNAPLPVTSFEVPAVQMPPLNKAALTKSIRKEMTLHGCDLVGIAPASRVNALVPQLAAIYDGDVEYRAENKADTIYKPYDPVITEIVRKVVGTDAYLEGAKSVVVLGMRLPRATTDITARTPAEAAGPYVFAQYESLMRLRYQAWNLRRILENHGYRVAITSDLHRTGSFCWNPRGRHPDAFANTFAAAAAGLCTISECGFAITPEFGANVRFLAIVTDADLDVDAVRKDIQTYCASCEKTCVKACHTAAPQSELHAVDIDGLKVSFRKIDINRCNWAKGYSLIATEGNQYAGWHLDIPYPVDFSKQAFEEALRKIPQVEKVRPCNFEQCLMACPHCRPQR